MSDREKNLRRSCQLADKILAEVVGNLQKGKSEKEVASEIRKLSKSKAGGIAFSPIVAFGRNSATPHHRATIRKLKKGDIVKIDLGVKYHGWCSDITRTFFTAEPTIFQKEVYRSVLAAQKLGIKKAKAGLSGKALDEIVRAFLRKKKLAKRFIHSLGHGIGKKVHESPKISPKSKAFLKINDAITIEPGIYLKNRFGIRIEDTILLKKDGVEILTKFPKKLTVLKI